MAETTSKMSSRTFDADRILGVLVHMSPWYWVAAIYGAQTVGAIFVTFFFKVKAHQTWLPIALLAFGALASAVMGSRDRHKTMTRSLCWLPLLLYALFIFSLSSRSFSGAEISFKADYFHLVEFSTLGLFLCCFWEPILRRGKPLRLFACVFAFGVLCGVADEFHQSFVPGRDPSAWDVLYDAVGVIIGCGIYLLGRWLHGTLAVRMGDPVSMGQPTAARGLEKVLPAGPLGDLGRERQGL
jgi:VanZ family protein